MKSKIFVLGMCLATLTLSYANAKNIKFASHKRLKLISKGDVSIPLYTASSKSNFALIGKKENYQTLLFTKVSINGTESEDGSSKFTVESGSYQIDFTGKFLALPYGGSTVKVAVQVGSSPLEESINTIEIDPDASREFTFTQVINVNEKTKISIVAQKVTEGKPVIVSERLLTITKLS